MKIQISVVIPTLNEEKNLRTLLPYLRQHGQDAVTEIIVTDGGSTDETQAVCKANGVTFFTSHIPGRGAQLSEGATRASGSILWFVHADTLPPETFVSDLRDALSQGHQYGCFRYRFDTGRAILRFNSWMTRMPFIWCRGGDQTLFITRAFYDEIGGFNPGDIVMEDYNILVKAQKKGQKLHIIPKEALVSDRKYAHNSYLRVNLANLIVFTMWRWGIQPATLKQVYYRLIRHPKG